MNNDSSAQPQSSAGSLIKTLEFTADRAMRLADANSVLGERIEADGLIIIPVSKLSVGFAGGGADMTDLAKRKKQNPVGAGAKVTLTPMTFLVIENGTTRLMDICVPEKSSMTSEVINSVVTQVKGVIASAKEAKEQKKSAKKNSLRAEQ